MFNDLAPSRPVILVVVDDPADRSLIRKGLESADFRIEEAVDGLSALEIFRTVHPHTVLLDVAMPGISGAETCTALRQLPGGAHVPILMVMSDDDMHSITSSYEAGASDILIKPIHPHGLAQRIGYLLRAHHALLVMRKPPLTSVMLNPLRGSDPGNGNLIPTHYNAQTKSPAFSAGDLSTFQRPLPEFLN
jgi:DNA-binding response OmpR family regulator